MSEAQPILYDISGGVATISFNRPERRNSWTTELETAYFEALISASADEAVRVIVVTGNPEGRAFCPGLDMDELHKAASGDAALARRRWPHTLLTQVPKPTIAAVNGPCAGLGLIQAL